VVLERSRAGRQGQAGQAVRACSSGLVEASGCGEQARGESWERVQESPYAYAYAPTPGSASAPHTQRRIGKPRASGDGLEGYIAFASQDPGMVLDGGRTRAGATMCKGEGSDGGACTPPAGAPIRGGRTHDLLQTERPLASEHTTAVSQREAVLESACPAGRGGRGAGVVWVVRNGARRGVWAPRTRPCGVQQ
jgi:hypothetical protein